MDGRKPLAFWPSFHEISRTTIKPIRSEAIGSLKSYKSKFVNGAVPFLHSVCILCSHLLEEYPTSFVLPTTFV